MIIVYKAYDDNSAELLDICTYRRMELTEIQLIKFVANGGEALGLSVSKNKINYIQAYDMVQFPTEYEADEFIRNNNLSSKNKKYINDMFCVLFKSDKVYHVKYYICIYRGDEIIYVGDKGGYTPYIQAAKTFDKRTAGQKSALMTNNSKTGKHWTTRRVVVG